VKEQASPIKFKLILRLAAVYNILWGAWVIFFPSSLFSWLNIPPPNYLEIWQCVGMIVGVYGVGYWIASYNPLTHWPITFVGFLGKILGPIGFIFALIKGTLPIGFLWVILFNDVIWWIPFFLILKAFLDSYINEEEGSLNKDQALQQYRLSTGETLKEASEKNPLLLIFVRHFGCTFCRETLAELKEDLPKILDKNIRPVIIHMGGDEKMNLARYSLEAISSNQTSEGLETLSDPERKLYRAFGLKRGTFQQLFGKEVFLKGIRAILKYGVGDLEGDGFQMPGAFLIENGVIVETFIHRYASDQIPFSKLCRL
jgi:thioredoxin-related protein